MANLKNAVSGDDHALGKLDAAVVMVEYGDYECPHCRMAHAVIRKVQKHYGERLCFVFRNFPLSQIHPFAQTAAETAEFAASHGTFWEMHDLLFKHQDEFSETLFPELAEKLGLDATELQKAISEQTYTARVRSDFTGGVRSGVNGTPTFFIQGLRHDGPAAFESLVAKIDEVLKA